jgi:hypothetical protein
MKRATNNQVLREGSNKNNIIAEDRNEEGRIFVALFYRRCSLKRLRVWYKQLRG